MNVSNKLLQHPKMKDSVIGTICFALAILMAVSDPKGFDFSAIAHLVLVSMELSLLCLYSILLRRWKLLTWKQSYFIIPILLWIICLEKDTRWGGIFVDNVPNYIEIIYLFKEGFN